MLGINGIDFHTALSDGTVNISYEFLNNIRIPVRNERVLICFENQLEQALFVVASLNSTCMVLPIHCGARTDEVEEYIMNGEIGVVLCSPSTAQAFERFFVDIYTIDISKSFEWEIFKICERSTKTDDDMSGLLLSTSGSTGKMKLVFTSVAVLNRRSKLLTDSLELTASDMTICLLPLYHIAGLQTTILTTVFSGGTCYFIPNKTPGCILKEIENQKPTWLSAVPKIYRSVCDYIRERQISHIPNRHRFIRSGADRLDFGTFNSLKAIFKTYVFVTYGMTECLPITTLTMNDLRSLGDSITNETLGKFSEGLETKLLDDGELWVRGSIAGSYINNSITTDGWMNTGDLVSIDENGFVTYRGRTRDILKVNGEQVSLLMIETLIQASGVVQGDLYAFSVDGIDNAVCIVTNCNDDVHRENIRQSINETLSEREDILCLVSILYVFDFKEIVVPKTANLGKPIRYRISKDNSIHVDSIHGMLKSRSSGIIFNNLGTTELRLYNELLNNGIKSID